MESLITLIALSVIVAAMAIYSAIQGAKDPAQDFLGFQSRRDEKRPSSERLRQLRDEADRFYRRSLTCTDSVEAELLRSTAQKCRNDLAQLRRDDDALLKSQRQDSTTPKSSREELI